MSALSPLFLWLIPLALLPVIIHLLNRLRYRTVQWAAMMFLRTADRDASKRAKIRQWIILAARCLMLLMFLLALARLQSKGRLARFFDPGSNLVIVLFDRSASMEQQRGGITGRERALALVQQGMEELDGSTRVLWLDSVSGEMVPIPTGVDLDLLPFTSATSTTSSMSALIRLALAEIARADVTRSEIWITTDRQSSAWLPEGAAAPDWSEWAGLQERVGLRLLDVGQISPDPGNRSLALVSGPRQEGDSVRMDLVIRRENPAAESIPIQIEAGGLSLREDLLVEGTVFQWEQELPLNREEPITHAHLSLPADSHLRDHSVSIAWKDPGIRRAGAGGLDDETERIVRAAFLPRTGVREWTDSIGGTEPPLLWMTGQPLLPDSPLGQWVKEGGILVQWPRAMDLEVSNEEPEPLEVSSWNESSGVLATQGRDPLRLDLVEVFSAIDLEERPEVSVLARLSNGRPLLTRESFGEGLIYRWATNPSPGFSNLADGYVLVPVIQRLIESARQRFDQTGTFPLGQLRFDPSETWTSLDDEAAQVGVDAGRYVNGDRLVALNRPSAEDRGEQLSLQELTEWAAPLNLRVFEDRSERGTPEASRSEFTGILALLGLLFLVVESWLLTRNIRKVTPGRSAWKGATV